LEANCTLQGPHLTANLPSFWTAVAGAVLDQLGSGVLLLVVIEISPKKMLKIHFFLLSIDLPAAAYAE
jgi:hypothetical protein